MSMLSLAEAQSAREQKGKHRPPDARAAQQQRWAETVEHWASEADAAWRLRSEARGRLRSADVALRGEQGRFAERLHGPGSTPFEVLSLPPPFAVEAIACGLCGDPPACKTECCGGYLCSACMESRERARAEFMASTALVTPWNPSLCYFCGRGPEASVPQWPGVK